MQTLEFIFVRVRSHFVIPKQAKPILGSNSRVREKSHHRPAHRSLQLPRAYEKPQPPHFLRIMKYASIGVVLPRKF